MLRGFACTLGWSVALPGLAASQAIPAAAICEDFGGQRVVSPVLLQAFVLEKVSYMALDADLKSGATPDETFGALTQFEWCYPESGRRKACSAADTDVLFAGRAILEGFFQNHPDIEFTYLRRPTTDEVRARPGLTREPFALLLDEDRRFVAMRCKAAADETASGQTDSDPPDPPKLSYGKFLLSKELEGLTASRGSPDDPQRLEKVPAAEISFIDDRVKNTESLSVSAVAGLKLADVGAATLIPYVQLNRTRVEDKGAQTEKETGKLAIGLLETGLVTRYDRLDGSISWVRDLEDRAEILSSRISWRPGFLYDAPSFQKGLPLACSGERDGRCLYGKARLILVTDAQLIGSFGTVLRKGMDPDLTDGREYLRAGPNLRASLYGLSGAIRDFSLDITYRRLFGIAGDERKVYALKSGLNYWIAGSQHVAVRFGFEKGRDEDTLDKFELLKLGLGVRY